MFQFTGFPTVLHTEFKVQNVKWKIKFELFTYNFKLRVQHGSSRLHEKGLPHSETNDYNAC